ncbi:MULTISPECIES: hypothetical protein [unclassified Streptomyces]|uniref:hypothetical protein n=1 Tax=unclassified Streptomyces TaxID=2593676 RepID=UPI000AD583CE|nr:hypothetical protein [Streptomyces sp. NRRL S-118]
MTGFMGTMGDRILGRLVPKAVAQADTTFEKICYCNQRNRFYFRQICHVVGGYTSCGTCYISSPCPPSA